jgi:DNA topoisomerase IB
MITSTKQYELENAFSLINLCSQGEKDWQKYETARRLHQVVDKIRDQYRLDWKSKEMRIRQRSVALYFIDKVLSAFYPSCKCLY